MQAAISLKQVLATGLWPLARTCNLLAGRARRLWAYSRLQAALGPLDPSLVVLGMPELHGTGQIRLGRRLYLYRELYLETRDAGRITLGDDVVMSRGVHVVSHAEVVIGAGTMIGEYSSIRDANHRQGGSEPLRSSGHRAASVRIGRQVWIGRGVTVLPGVEIGDRAVIGANAVVSHSVPAGAVVAGVPARALCGSGS